MPVRVIHICAGDYKNHYDYDYECEHGYDYDSDDYDDYDYDRDDFNDIKVSIFEIYFFFKSPNCNQRYGTVALWHSGTDYDDYSDDCDDYNYDRDYSNDIKGLYI